MRIRLYCFKKERNKYGERIGAGCNQACHGCAADIGILWIDETPPDYQRGRDHAHKRKPKFPPGELAGTILDVR